MVSLSSPGVYGRSFGNGLYGEPFSENGTGVYGRSLSGDAVVGSSESRAGVYGNSKSSVGIYGNTTSGVAGIVGHGSMYGVGGVENISNPEMRHFGVVGANFSELGHGVAGYSVRGIGVYGKSERGNDAYSAFMGGRVYVRGLIQKPGGAFKIDHPLDPANKYLSHSFVESPDMKNFYDGVIALDNKGEATINLPDWFGALNGFSLSAHCYRCPWTKSVYCRGNTRHCYELQ
jgi:hypothetical protein